MKFGIMAMQMEALLPPVSNAQEAMQHVASFSHAGLIRKLHSAGFSLIELGGDLGMWFPTAFSPTVIEELAQLKDELELAYTVHLPLWSVEPSTPLQAVRLGSVQALTDCIHATLPLQPACYVLHATGALAAEFYQMRLPPAGKGLILRQFQQNALQSIQELLQQTGLPPRKLAIETIEFPFDLTLEMAERLDLSVCLDTGHVLAGFSGALDVFTVLEQVLPHLGEVHLHDCPRPARPDQPSYGMDHQPLGSGDLDTARLLDRLSESGFDGPVIFELTVPQALSSLQVIRQLRPALLA
ncbi:sugar phosphate isomerase [Bellilinea caldifistulae]|nr:cobamide remodeling phosphodiesterase CbiR [Bellilinea caldifistulae]GAP12023.1 sugar phosphate isomerase [Bellilinea caldifistulae]